MYANGVFLIDQLPHKLAFHISFMVLFIDKMFRYLSRGFRDSNLFLKSIIRIALFMVLSVFPKWFLGAPPHARVSIFSIWFYKHIKYILEQGRS